MSSSVEEKLTKILLENNKNRASAEPNLFSERLSIIVVIITLIIIIIMLITIIMIVTIIVIILTMIIIMTIL